jgi:hypothetical protein
MANYSMIKPTAGSKYGSWARQSEEEVRIRILSFLDATTLKGSALVQNDTIDLFTVEAGMLVKDVYARILVPDAASTTMQIGDTANAATEFVTSVTLDSVAQTFFPGNGLGFMSAGGTVAGFSGVFYATADTIRCKINSSGAPATAGLVEVTAVLVPVGTSLTL